MSDPNSKQQMLESLSIADSLENLPSGKLISVLKNKLDSPKFMEGINYISEFVLKSILAVCPQEVITQIDDFNLKGQTTELANLLTIIIATKKEVAQAADNGLNFSARVIARLNSISLN